MFVCMIYGALISKYLVMAACAKLSISLIMRTAETTIGYAHIAPVPSPSLSPKCNRGLAFSFQVEVYARIHLRNVRRWHSPALLDATCRRQGCNLS